MKVRGRERRHWRIRKKIFGTPERPRLCVYRSLKHIYGSLIDDVNNRTIVTVSTLTREIKGMDLKNNLEKARAVGKILAQRAKEKNIECVTFDRAGFKYHGQVRSLAEGAREGGLKF
ncbi:MAG: 50S ribosomal protein L18 [candidate division WOR-3 bacterium]